MNSDYEFHIKRLNYVSLKKLILEQKKNSALNHQTQI